MIQQTISALSIARPLLVELIKQPFSGRVWGRFNRACNLIDGRGRIIALTLPVVGNGPFTIVIAGQPGLFDTLSLNQPVQTDGQALMIGHWRIPLNEAKIWEPRIVPPDRPLRINSILEIIKPYADWPHLDQSTPAASNLAQLAREAATRLSQAITQSESQEMVEQAVTQLAGLGSGLTPAGDDYLVGVMATLWLTGQTDILPKIAEVAIPKTTTLSAAFLRAAARGEFIEPWHILTQALFDQDNQAVAKSIEKISQFGASSGTDALAGFAKTLLSLVDHSMRLH